MKERGLVELTEHSAFVAFVNSVLALPCCKGRAVLLHFMERTGMSDIVDMLVRMEARMARMETDVHNLKREYGLENDEQLLIHQTVQDDVASSDTYTDHHNSLVWYTEATSSKASRGHSTGKSKSTTNTMASCDRKGLLGAINDSEHSGVFWESTYPASSCHKYAPNKAHPTQPTRAPIPSEVPERSFRAMYFYREEGWRTLMQTTPKPYFLDDGPTLLEGEMAARAKLTSLQETLQRVAKDWDAHRVRVDANKRRQKNGLELDLGKKGDFAVDATEMTLQGRLRIAFTDCKAMSDTLVWPTSEGAPQCVSPTYGFSGAPDVVWRDSCNSNAKRPLMIAEVKQYLRDWTTASFRGQLMQTASYMDDLARRGTTRSPKSFGFLTDAATWIMVCQEWTPYVDGDSCRWYPQLSYAIVPEEDWALCIYLALRWNFDFRLHVDQMGSVAEWMEHDWWSASTLKHDVGCGAKYVMYWDAKMKKMVKVRSHNDDVAVDEDANAFHNNIIF